MGMYDNIICKYPLPDKEAQDLSFQTKDLECFLTTYEITAEGRLVEHSYEYEQTPEDELPDKDHPFIGSIRAKKNSFKLIDQNFHGVLNFYGDLHTGELMMINFKTGKDELHTGPKPEWFEYNAKFTDGKVVSIERLLRD